MSTLALKINEVVIENINSDFNEEITRMKDLDIGKITVINSTDDEAFDVDSEVEVIVDSISRYFILQKDTFERVSKNPYEYEHILDLMEVTKKLEGISLPKRRFIQPINGVLGDSDVYTVWDKLELIRKTANLLTTTNYTAGLFPFEYSTEDIVGLGLTLEEYTSVIKAKTQTINEPNVREALDQIMQEVGLEVRMMNFNEVGADYINARTSEIDLSNVIIYKGSQVLNQYADKVDYFIENGISDNNLNKQAIKYPSTAWASVRGKDSFLKSNNFIMEVSEPIDRVLKFEIYVKCEMFTVSPTSSTTVTFQADVTDILHTKDKYDSLTDNLTAGVGGYSDTVCHNNSLYYQRNGKTIEGFHYEIDTFSSITTGLYAFNHLLAYAYYKSTGNLALKGAFDTLSPYYDFMFRLTYVPLQKERLRLEKKNPIGTRTLQLNQQERIPDVEKLGRKGIEDLERLGNKELIIGKTVDNYANVFELGQYATVNNEIYTMSYVRNAVDRGEIISIGGLSKGSQNISLEVGVNTEARDTPIDSTNAIERQEIYNEYIQLGFDTTVINDTFVTSSGLQRYAETFNVETVSGKKPVELVKFTGSQILILQCTSKGTANVIKFDFGFDSVNIAGRKVELVDGVWVNQYVEYAETDNGARLENMRFTLFGGLESELGTFADDARMAQELPQFNLNDTLEDIYIISDELKLFKDGGEILKMTYQLSHFDITGDIIIGDKLSTNNALVIAEQEKLYVVKRFSKFVDRQVLLPSELTFKLEVINTGTPTSSQIKLEYTSTASYASVTVGDSGNYYWAIVNEENEVYLAVNNLTEKTVYFNPRENRS